MRPVEHGGADRDRTGDPLLAKQVLSHLSYSPIEQVVGLGRLELPTSPLSGVRSNQLSYRPTITCDFRTKLESVDSNADSVCSNYVSFNPSRTWLNMRSSYAASDHRC